ncbi:MAG: cell division protein SepF [Candidatus Syntropharchaeia archaeon]
MAKFVEKLIGKRQKPDVSEYIDLDIGEYEQELEETPVEMYVKTAELTHTNDIPDIRKEIYDGNIVIMDISLAKQDKLLIDRAISDLKEAVNDVGGDIAGMGDDYVVITPGRVKIDRKKIRGK